MTIIFPSPIFGPIHSRRLGVSLGINLLPEDGKVRSTAFTVSVASMPNVVRRSFSLPVKKSARLSKRN